MARFGSGPEKTEFEGKVAIVTGASRGIGRAISEALGRRGASLLMGDINEQLGQVAARSLGSDGITARFAKVDVRVEWDVERFVKYAVQVFGRIDILVTAAGILRLAPIEKIKEEDYRAMFDTNVLGVALMAKHAVPHMEKSGGGSIVVISSVSGQVGFPDLSLYCASKAAVAGMTRALAVELASKRIRVNALMPSLVDTDMMEEEMAAREQLGQGSGDVLLDKYLDSQPIPKLATAQEVAEAACFLASPNNPLMTGVLLPIDGGLTCA